MEHNDSDSETISEVDTKPAFSPIELPSASSSLTTSSHNNLVKDVTQSNDFRSTPLKDFANDNINLSNVKPNYLITCMKIISTNQRYLYDSFFQQVSVPSTSQVRNQDFEHLLPQFSELYPNFIMPMSKIIILTTVHERSINNTIKFLLTHYITAQQFLSLNLKAFRQSDFYKPIYGNN